MSSSLPWLTSLPSSHSLLHSSPLPLDIPPPSHLRRTSLPLHNLLPPSAEGTSHGFSRFQQISRQAPRARRTEEEIDELEGLRVVSADFEVDDEDSVELRSKLNSKSDFDVFGKPKVRIVEPKFRMTLAELLDESKVVPIMVYGNLEAEITGI